MARNRAGNRWSKGISGGGALRLSRLLILGFQNEGVAASGPCDPDSPTPVPPVLVEDARIVACGTGVEAGYGRPWVTVQRTVARRCAVGIRLGDDYDWGCHGALAVHRSSAEGCGLALVAASYAPGYGKLLGPRPGQVRARCSWLPGWQAGLDLGGIDGFGWT